LKLKKCQAEKIIKRKNPNPRLISFQKLIFTYTKFYPGTSPAAKKILRKEIITKQKTININ